MRIGYRIPVDTVHDADAWAIQEESKKWVAFSQYTDIEALLCILKNRELKANSIKNVDDLKEQIYLEPLREKDEAFPYVSCFDYSKKENIPLWNMYSDDKYGARIQFIIPKTKEAFHTILIDTTRCVKGCRFANKPIEFHLQQITDEGMPYPKAWVHTTTMPIVYKNSLEISGYQLPANNLINWAVLASIKSEEWRFQNEVRIVADFQHTEHTALNDNVEIVELPNFEYLLIPIKLTGLEKLVITFSPWMQDETKRMVTESIEQLKLDCEYVVQNSCFDKLIRRK